MSRLTLDEWALTCAVITSERATCLRRRVGCVLLNTRGHVIATGYNGVASGIEHCNEGSPCPGSTAPSGMNLDGCRAIHAEQNALLQCRDVYSIGTCYTTASPCMTCVKLLLNTGCRRIVFLEEYPHREARELWVGGGREWLHHPKN